DAEDRSFRERGADLALPRVGGTVIVGRKALGGPDVDGRRARAARSHVLRDLVDLHDRLAAGVVSCDHPPYVHCHVSYSLSPNARRRTINPRTPSSRGPPTAPPRPPHAPPPSRPSARPSPWRSCR